MLYRVVYLSSARQLFSAVELDLLLASSRRRNDRDDITGLLLYDDGNFLQALEGEDAVLPVLMRRIENDRRHHGMSYVAAGPIASRMFGRWSMAFGRSAPESLDWMVGQMKVTQDGTSDVALAMLKVFMRNMRPERVRMPDMRPSQRPLPQPPVLRRRPELAAHR